MLYNFSTVRIVLGNLGFVMKAEHDVAFFRHPTGPETLIGLHIDLGSNYLREKMDDIELPFAYFESLIMTVKKLSKN